MKNWLLHFGRKSWQSPAKIGENTNSFELLNPKEDFWIVQKIYEHVLDLVQDFEDEGDVVKHRKSSPVPSKLKKNWLLHFGRKFCQSPAKIGEKTDSFEHLNPKEDF